MRNKISAIIIDPDYYKHEYLDIKCFENDEHAEKHFELKILENDKNIVEEIFKFRQGLKNDISAATSFNTEVVEIKS